VHVLVSVVERDLAALGLRSNPGAGVLRPFENAVRRAGLQVGECWPARRDDVAQLGSSWAKRLGIPERRSAWLLRAEKP
jgi:hypothetical protein